MNEHARQNDDRALAGLRAICLAANVPGPAAAALLAAQGMAVVKIEPPFGDMTAALIPSWYADLNRAARIETADLRTPAGLALFRAHVQGADLLITSHRPSALGRMGITGDALAAINPGLCWIEIVGDVDAPEVPGHDLTYQAAAGLLAPPAMPRSLLADLAGADAAAAAATALLLGRERGRPGRHARVGLMQAAMRLAAPIRHGATALGGVLSGAGAGYAIHRLRDGWAACAALEPRFAERLAQVAGTDVAGFLANLTMAETAALAAAHDLPIHAFPG